MAKHPDTKRKKIHDAHAHIGVMGAFNYYNNPEPINPTVEEYADTKEFLKILDHWGIEKALSLPNYGLPDSKVAFKFNPTMMKSIQESDRCTGGIWVSPITKDNAEVKAALSLAGTHKSLRCVKMTCLLGGNWDPEKWDEPTKEQMDLIVNTATKNKYYVLLHTSPGGGSDISNAWKFIENYGKDVPVYLAHMGGGVSGQIKFVPEFLRKIKAGFKLYTDPSWSTGFGPRLLLHEIERTGVGAENVMFGSDLPWSDFMGEYWKIEGVEGVSEELKENIFWRNFEKFEGI
jgi:predicted TIM-barrel fold metal-dependent hydrolase